MEKITAETMRSYNRRQIFNHIYFNKRSSRQEIADTLHLSLTTVTQNLKLLEEENLILKKAIAIFTPHSNRD